VSIEHSPGTFPMFSSRSGQRWLTSITATNRSGLRAWFPPATRPAVACLRTDHARADAAVRRDGHRCARRFLGRPRGRRPSSSSQHGQETCRAWFRYGIRPSATWPSRTTHGRRLHHVAPARGHANLTTRGTASQSWIRGCRGNGRTTAREPIDSQVIQEAGPPSGNRPLTSGGALGIQPLTLPCHGRESH
jgi:hypothetical protein